MRWTTRTVVLVSLITAASVVVGSPSAAVDSTTFPVGAEPSGSDGSGWATVDLAILGLVSMLAFGTLVAGALSPLAPGARRVPPPVSGATPPVAGRSRVVRTSRSSSAR